MLDPFESARRKIARAKKHIAEFEAESQRFCLREDLYEVFVDKDSERPGKEIWKLRLIQPFPDIFDEIVGDAINNLRAALDHACYAAAVSSGKIKPRHAYFPFGKDETDFENTMRGNSKDVPVEIQSIIRWYGPYKGGNDPLWALNRIAVRDKHMRLIRVGIRVLNSISGIGGGHARFPVDPIWDSDKNEIEFAEFTSGVHAEYHFKFGTHIAFGEVEGIDGDPVSPALDWFVKIVEHAISSIEEESRRLWHIP